MNSQNECRQPVQFTKLVKAEFDENERRFLALVADLEKAEYELACSKKEVFRQKEQYELLRGNHESLQGRFAAARELLDAANGRDKELNLLRNKYESVVEANREYTSVIASIKMGGVFPIEQIYKFKEDTIREQLGNHLGRTLLYDNDFQNVILAQHPDHSQLGNPFDTFGGKILESLYYQDVYLGLFIQDGNNYSFQPATDGQT